MKICLRRNKLLLFLTVFFSVVCSAASVAVALFLQKIVDITLAGDLAAFWKILIFVLIYLLVFVVLYYIYSYLGKRFLKNITRILRERVFEGIFRQNYGDFTGTNTADYISALTNDIKLVEENYILPLLLTLQYAVTFFVTLIVLFLLSPAITLCLLACMVLMFTVPSLLGKALQKRQDAVSEKLSVFTMKLKDMFSGYEVITSFGILPDIRKKFMKENEETVQTKFKADRLLVLNESISQMLGVFSQVAAIFLAAYFVINGKMTMGTLIAILQLSGSFVMPIVMIMENLSKVRGIKPVLERLEDFSDYESTEFTGDKTPFFDKEIRMEQVGFSYTQGQEVLNKLDLKIEKNKKYAIVGGSGCGKTTLIKLMMGYYANFTGNITYDGVSMEMLDMEKLKKMISVIHQNVYMFDETVLENIRLYQKIGSESLDRALELSGVDRFLNLMPDGLNSPVGENGENLSGGQRQRIAIARALVQKTPVLILDEGTSAVDMQTAYDIESRLLKVAGLTLLTITHKMSEDLLGLYDQILFMENGQVAEKGTLEDLLKKQGRFFEFYTLKDQ